MSARCALVVVAVTLLAGASCGDGESGDAGTLEVMSVPDVSVVVTITATPTTLASSSGGQPPTTTTVEPAPNVVDAVAGILAAVASYWPVLSSSTMLHFVVRLGTANAHSVIEYSDKSPEMTDEQRDFIAKALAPRAVLWVRDPNNVRGTVPPITVPSGEAIVTFSEPVVDGSQARVYANLWCGMECGEGLGFVVEQTTSGEWAVTEEFDSFVV